MFKYVDFRHFGSALSCGGHKQFFLLLYYNEISDQICIDFRAENGWKLPVAAAKARCNTQSLNAYN